MVLDEITYASESDPALLRRVARRMLPLIPQDAEILAGLELGGVPIATAMSLECGIATVFVRKKAKAYGTCQAVEGGEIRGRKVVIVKDVITTGGAVSTGGASPALARAVREELEQHLGDDYAALVDVAGEVRRELRAGHRRVDARAWHEALNDPRFRRLVTEGRRGLASDRLRARLTANCADRP